MRETNTWMIRKMRWILWGTFSFIPMYRNFYWDYLGRRVAWKESLSSMSEDEKRQYWEARRADWGFHPRFEASLPFSIKTAKYAAQTREEALRDVPRIRTADDLDGQAGIMKSDEVNSLVMVARDHNRQPGTFDYSVPQNFYASHPEIDSESYITLGAGNLPMASRRVHTGSKEKVYS